jgi:hypothetical protein
MPRFHEKAGVGRVGASGDGECHVFMKKGPRAAAKATFS